MKYGLEFFIYFETPLASLRIVLTGQTTWTFLADFLALGISNSEGAHGVLKWKIVDHYVKDFKPKKKVLRAEILVHLYSEF